MRGSCILIVLLISLFYMLDFGYLRFTLCCYLLILFVNMEI